MPDPARPSTLRDVAEAAGVSTATASRILSQQGSFAPATRARVLDAADRLGYVRAWTKHGRPTVDLPAVDLIIGRIGGGWTDRVINGAWRAAAREGVDLTLMMERRDSQDNWPERVSRRRSLGVVFGLVQPLAAELDALRVARLPVVLLDPLSDADLGVRTVGTTDWAGGYAAGKHLVSSGVTNFISVVARPTYRFVRARADGYAAALTEFVPDRPLETIQTNWDQRGPIRELTALLRQASTPLGLFACNDAIALRCYESIELAGLSVGTDVLVVGFDDEARAVEAHPPLTTLYQPIEAMAAHAVTLLVDAGRSGEGLSAVREELPARLVVRASTSAPQPVTATD